VANDEVEDEPDEAGPDTGDDAPPPPLIHRPQGNWLDDRLEEYLIRLEDLGFGPEDVRVRRRG